jgi:hypothetical protein
MVLKEPFPMEKKGLGFSSLADVTENVSFKITWGVGGALTL